MGGVNIPLVALQGQPYQAPPTPLDEYYRAARLKALQAQTAQQEQQTAQAGQAFPLEQQQRQQEVQAKQIQLEDMQKLHQLSPQYVTRDEQGKPSGYDWDGFYNAALQSGVNPQTIMAAKAQQLEFTQKLAAADKTKQEAEESRYKKLYEVFEGIKGVQDPAQRQQAYMQSLPRIASLGIDIGKFPTQVPDDATLTTMEAPFGQHAQMLADAKTLADISKKERPDTDEQRFQDYYKSKLAASGQKPDAKLEFQTRQEFMAKSHTANNLMTGDDAKQIADAIASGDQPPTLQGLYRNAGPVRAELARRGVPLAKMESDWKATQRFLGTLNGPQQTRLRQAAQTASDSLDKIEGLYAEWQKIAPTAGFKVWNRGVLKTAKNLPGRAGAVATALDAQIADLTSELGNVYMGGNSPTDHSLDLANKNLSSDWNEETFKEALKQARANLQIRMNSITHAAPAGVSQNSPYMPQGQTPASTSRGAHKVGDVIVQGGHRFKATAVDDNGNVTAADPL